MKALLLFCLMAWPLGLRAEQAAPADAPGNSVSGAAAGEEIPAPPVGARDLSGNVGAVPLPKAEAPVEVPNKPFVWKAKGKGFPFLEVGLAALGGGLAGGFVGFLNSTDSRGVLDSNLEGKNIALYGGVGFAAGALLGYAFSFLDPILLHPPEPTAGLVLAMAPRGGLALSARW